MLAREARLAALEQTVGVNGASAQWRAFSVAAGWPLFGGLSPVAWVLVQHWRAGGRR